MVRPVLVVLIVAIIVMCTRESSAQGGDCSRNNEVWVSCGSACPPRCGARKPGACIQVCQPGCQCKRGFYRRSDGECVRGDACNLGTKK